MPVYLLAPLESETIMKTSTVTAALLAGVTVLGLAAPAMAAPSTSAPDLATTMAKCVAAVDVRVAKLSTLNVTVGGSKHITATHRSTEQSTFATASSGLTDLKAKIEADTDAATLKQDCESIYAGYRVFALRAPQAHLIIAGDAETFAVGRLQTGVPKLSDAIAKAKAAGQDTTKAEALFADLQAKLADAATQSGGIGDSVIGYGPADWNANHALLTPARGKVVAARADLRIAVADVKGIVAELKHPTA